jgi:hypothetical protein
MLTINAGSAKQFDGHPSMFVIGRVVVDPTGIIEGEWPEFNVRFFGPM